MLHCDRNSIVHNRPIFPYVQFLAPSASADPCFNQRFLTFLLRKHDTPLQFPPSSSNPPISFLRLSFAHCLRVVPSIITIFASIPISMRLRLCAFSFRSLPPHVMSLTNLLSNFSPLLQLIIRHLGGVPCTGYREG